MDVLIYSKQNCGYCVKAKTWFKSKNIEFQEIDLSIEENRNKFLNDVVPHYPNARTMPQIFINGEHIGGYDDLIAKQDYVLNQE